jgi:hypothetical protein
MADRDRVRVGIPVRRRQRGQQRLVPQRVQPHTMPTRAANRRLNGPYPIPATPCSGSAAPPRASSTARSISAKRPARPDQKQRRLRHLQPLGGAPEVQLLADRDEVAQLSQLDRKIHSRGY